MKSLKNKNVVITGAASGIGREMARLLARKGSNLAIIDINRHALEEIEKELSKNNVRVSTYCCDISDHEQTEGVAGTIKEDFKTIDVLINNAGIIIGKTIFDSTYEDFKKTIDVNLLGLMWMTNQFLPDMMERNNGHIVNVASSAGFQAVPKMGDYCASKSGIIGFSDTLRLEMKKFGYSGVKVTIVCPGTIDTGMFKGFKMPSMIPILKQEKVAQKVITAIEKEQLYVKTPFAVKLQPLFGCLPVKVMDSLTDFLGVNNSMDQFYNKEK